MWAPVYVGGGVRGVCGHTCVRRGGRHRSSPMGDPHCPRDPHRGAPSCRRSSTRVLGSPQTTSPAPSLEHPSLEWSVSLPARSGPDGSDVGRGRERTLDLDLRSVWAYIFRSQSQSQSVGRPFREDAITILLCFGSNVTLGSVGSCLVYGTPPTRRRWVDLR